MATSSPTPTPIVARTKFVPPRLRHDLVRRSELIDQLAAAKSRLTTICGPAGSGKSIVLAQWHESEESTAWLSLDDVDNDPVVLWHGLIESMDSATGTLDDDYLRQLLQVGPAAIDYVVAEVVNGLGESGVPLRLFIDDLHLLHDDTGRRSLSRLIRLLPDGPRVAVASRNTEPLPLARLRLEDDVTEIGAAELALRADEAHAMLGGLGTELGQDELALLLDRTEGWAAGLRMAGVALATHAKPRDFIASFTGTDRTVAQYLATEVLDNLSSDVQEFLLQTSVLRRLSGGLCDAVTERSGGARGLAELERVSAFVIPLDRSGEWYRYHDLFAELLCSLLERRYPADVSLLHRRAFEWFRDRGQLDDAIYHGLAAGEVRGAADVLSANWLDLVSTGRLSTVGNMLGRFDDGDVIGYQPLALTAAYFHGLDGNLDKARGLLSAAEKAECDGRPPDGSATPESALALARGSLALYGLRDARVSAERAYELEPPDSPWRPLAALLVGLARTWSGDVSGGAPFFEETAQAGSPNEFFIAYALGELAVGHLHRGDTEQALELSTRACEVITNAGLDDLFAAAVVHAAASLAHFAAGNRAEAGAHLQAAETPIAFLGNAFPLDGMRIRVLLAGAELNLDDISAARRHVVEAANLASAVPDSGVLGTELAELEAKLGSLPASTEGGPEARTLTPRELEVLELLSTELTTRQIGEELFLSRNTVKTHQASIYRKLGVSSRSQAVAAREALTVTSDLRQSPHSSA